MKYHHGDLKRALLERAEEVIEEAGLDAVKLSCLARDLGVSHSAPARHFKDRNDLLAALSMRALEALKQDIQDDAGYHSTDPLVRLNSLLKVQIRTAINRPAHFFILGSPELSVITGQAYADAMDEYSTMLRRCIRDAQRHGWHSDDEEDHLMLFALSLAVGLETNIRYANKATGPITGNIFVQISKNLENALQAIDLFVSCK